MSTLLTPEERGRSYNQWAAQSKNICWEDWLVCTQLRKVIDELSALEPFDHDTWNFGVAVRKWLEAAREEIE